MDFVKVKKYKDIKSALQISVNKIKPLFGIFLNSGLLLLNYLLTLCVSADLHHKVADLCAELGSTVHDELAMLC